MLECMHVLTCACVQGVHMMFQGSSQDLWTVSASARGSVSRAMEQHSRSNRQCVSVALLLLHCAKDMRYAICVHAICVCCAAPLPLRERATQGFRDSGFRVQVYAICVCCAACLSRAFVRWIRCAKERHRVLGFRVDTGRRADRPEAFGGLREKRLLILCVCYHLFLPFA